MSYFRLGKTLFFAIFILLGCSKTGTENRQANSDVAFSFGIRPSFKVKTPDEGSLGSDKTEILIKKKALEKEFLLSINSVSQEIVPMFTAGQSRVIYFKRAQDSLVAFESSSGYNTDVDNPTSRIVAVFPITSETDDEIAFDFNKGMSSLFMIDWAEEGDHGKLNSNYTLITAESSFLDDATFDKNRLVISQWARIGVPEMDWEDMPNPDEELKTVFRTVVFKYYLTPYKANPNFHPTLFSNLNMFGFFTGPTILNGDGESIRYALKFDATKPIIFALSANTPPELKPALTEGILYWNKAFGRKVLDVIYLKDKEIRAPNPDYNIIQWVDFPLATFAYADMQADPLTGEVTNAQIFMPSGFYTSSREDAEKLIREGVSKVRRARFSIKGFEPHNHCMKGLSPLSSKLAEALAQKDVTDEKIRELSGHWMASVVAHEVGHTLGLRHNFAGNLVGSHNSGSLAKMVTDFLATGDLAPGTLLNSTVMDYPVSEEELLIGFQVRKSSYGALPYDQAIIQNLYNGKEFQMSDVPPFCTDEDLGNFTDCWQFDGGKSSIEIFSEYFNWYLDQAPRRIFNFYISEKIKGKKVANLTFEQKPWLKKVLNMRAQARLALTAKSQARAVARWYEAGSLFEDQIISETLDQNWVEVRRLGGLETIYKPLTFDWAQEAYDKFDEILNRESNGLRLGKPFAFSAEEQKVMRKNVLALFKSLYSQLVIQDFTQLKTLELADHEMVDDLAELNLKNASHFVFSKTGAVNSETMVTTFGKSLSVRVPEYTYDKKIRAAAIGILSLKGRPGWGVNEREELKELAANELSVLKEASTVDENGNTVFQINWKKSSPGLRRWFFDQIELFQGAGISF